MLPFGQKHRLNSYKTYNQRLKMKKNISVYISKAEEKYRTLHKEKMGLTLFDNYVLTPRTTKKDIPITQNYVVFIVKCGSGVVEYNSERTPIQKNTVIQATPGKHLRIVPNEEGIIISGLSYSKNFLLENKISDLHSDVLHFVSTLYSQVWHLSNEDTNRIRTAYERVSETLDVFDTHYFGRALLVHQFQIFLFEMGALTKKHTQLHDLNFSRKEKLAMQFSKLVQEQFRTERKLSHYAEQMHISTKYLTEVVKEITGKNASEIINDHVIMEAKFLLRRNELTIANIAETLNFSDQSFFGKFFKRNVGMSPKSFQMYRTKNLID